MGAPEPIGPYRGMGLAEGMVEFARPLVDAAGENPTALNNALQLGMLFYNIGALADAGDDFVAGQLAKMERATEGEAGQFRDIAVMMLARYAAVRPAAGPHLRRILKNLWGRDLI